MGAFDHPVVAEIWRQYMAFPGYCDAVLLGNKEYFAVAEAAGEARAKLEFLLPVRVIKTFDESGIRIVRVRPYCFSFKQDHPCSKATEAT